METTTQRLSIRYGFLSGNLFAGWDSHELEKIDAAGSVHLFAAQCEQALAEEFPGANIEVVWQDAEGVTPANIRTDVYDPQDPDANPGRLCEHVELVAGRVFEAESWFIPVTGQA